MLSLSNSASPASNKELESDNVTLFSTADLKFGLIKALLLLDYQTSNQQLQGEIDFVCLCGGDRKFCVQQGCV